MSLFVSLLLLSNFLVGSNAGACYSSKTEECTCLPLSCNPETCQSGQVGVWSEDCPISCDPETCDPYAPSADDPPCTGPPESIDRYEKKMYRRKLIEKEMVQDDDQGVICYLVFELCPGESQITHGMDSGYGDYYRLGATKEWQDYKGTPEYQYSGMKKPWQPRSYSPVTPLNDNTVQLMIKKTLSNYEGSDKDCTPGVDCEHGMSALACELPVGSDFLLSVVPDQPNNDYSNQYVYVPNFSRVPGNGPYTVNIIGQGIALTELNIMAFGELLEPIAPDGSFSTIKVVNYLWANSYWSNTKWVWENDEATDLARKLMMEMGKYGIRFNLMHAISREQRPEAEFPRINFDVLGAAFNLQVLPPGEQDPNIKWNVVGSSGIKNDMYAHIQAYGFDIEPCPRAYKGFYPACGTNAVYDQYYGDPDDRERSMLFEFSEEGLID